MVLVNELESITLPDGTTQALGPGACDTFSTVSSRTSVCWVMESGFSRADQERNYHELFRGVCLPSPLPILDPYPSSCSKSLSCSQHSQLLPSLQRHLFPLLLKTLSERSAFPLALRDTRTIFLLLKQFSSE
jgi:hypothetical protein